MTLVYTAALGAIAAILSTSVIDQMTLIGIAVAAITVPLAVRYIVTGSPFPERPEEGQHD